MRDISEIVGGKENLRGQEIYQLLVRGLQHRNIQEPTKLHGSKIARQLGITRQAVNNWLIRGKLAPGQMASRIEKSGMRGLTTRELGKGMAVYEALSGRDAEGVLLSPVIEINNSIKSSFYSFRALHMLQQHAACYGRFARSISTLVNPKKVKSNANL